MKNKTAIDWFKKWSNDYDNTLGRISRHHKLLDLAVKMSQVKDGDKVLDIGCGTGLLSLKFLKKAPCTIIGIDNSKEMMAIFKRKIKALKLGGSVKCFLQDASELRFKPGTFDIVASTVTLHHLTNKLPAIKNIYKTLKPGGRFVIGDIDLDTSGKVTNVSRLKRVMEYLSDELVLAIENGGETALRRMFENGRKHLFQDGEYCISFKQWSSLCKKAGFRKVSIQPLKEFAWFKVLAAVK